MFGVKLNPLKQYDAAQESFNEELVATGIGLGVFKVGGLAFRALRAAGGSIWNLSPARAEVTSVLTNILAT